MPKLFVNYREGVEKRVEAPTGLTLMEAIRNNGFDEMMALCGGCCSCGTCHVLVDPGFIELLPGIGEDEDAQVQERKLVRSATPRCRCRP
jgi:ferredoxin, 2Fe-2S